MFIERQLCYDVVGISATRDGTMRGLVPVIAMSALTLAGCATLRRGTTEQVAVVSDPPGALATATIGQSCTTPCSIEVPRSALFSVTVSKPGFATRTVALSTQVSGTGAAISTENIATAGLGLAVDAATGAILEHVPNAVSVTLTPTGSRPAAKPAAKTALLR